MRHPVGNISTFVINHFFPDIFADVVEEEANTRQDENLHGN